MELFSKKLSNKKKVRGGKRQAARVEAWRQAHRMPDLNHLEAYGCDYAKLTLDPWYRLDRRTPPARLRRQMLAAMLDVRAAWAEAFAHQPPEYLAVWVGWPNFMESQVVLATGEQAKYYRALHPVLEESKPLPNALGLTPALHANLSALNWRESLDEYPLLAEDLPDDGGAWLSSRPHRITPLRAGGAVYWLERGRVWIGE
ncbi:hypothetical protein [Deinococcus puniceus]|uniref:hypothetical protein n=1 Tax=Deinococcus puniceus TaxID=1182568 RepID=UPI0007C91C4E|nr:hypothetical protein [Deinococcus puniceus]